MSRKAADHADLSPALRASLGALGDTMRRARDPWWVIGSAAVALHGADPGEVADVDCLLSVDDTRRILPALRVEPRRGGDHELFASEVLAVWDAPPIPVEFMAAFRHRSGTSWVDVRPASREAVGIDEAVVFIPARADLLRLLNAFGRPKDMLRARALAVSG